MSEGLKPPSKPAVNLKKGTVSLNAKHHEIAVSLHFAAYAYSHAKHSDRCVFTFPAPSEEQFVLKEGLLEFVTRLPVHFFFFRDLKLRVLVGSLYKHRRKKLLLQGWKQRYFCLTAKSLDVYKEKNGHRSGT